VIYDVAIVGAGPAGAVCAAVCAAGGMRTLLLERAAFPRDKVCGDCLNPLAWPVLERLGVAEPVRRLPHAELRELEIAAARGRPSRQTLPPGPRGEIGLRRRALDDLLLRHAGSRGAEVRTESPVERAERAARGSEWVLSIARERGAATPSERIHARWLVAADGRNSTVARLLGLLPAASRERVALQTRLPLAAGMAHRVAMRFLPWGYSGLADIGGGEMNLCLVARPRDLDALKNWARSQFAAPEDADWQSVTPLSRKAIKPVQGSLLLVGDAARVVEPFTGEGIAYALATGEMAARALLAGEPAGYARGHARLYAGRLWINRLARAACLYPRFASALLQTAQVWPSLLAYLTRKVTGPREVQPTI
jgi:menaquinone-9 beta-reductase